jgi:protein O-mannosyl-transferase
MKPSTAAPSWAIALALVVATFLAFWPVADNGFVGFDDPRYITANEKVRAGLTADGIAWAFTTTHAYNWHPLTWISHQTDVEAFGLDAGAHHLMSVAFHAANAVLLFALLRSFEGGLWSSVLAAFLFALHPLRVESVAWASERKDVLGAMFWLVTMLLYVAYARRPTVGRYALVVAAFGAGLMAKPMLVTLPATLLLLDYWPLHRLESTRDLWPRVREKLPLMPLVLAVSFATIVAQGEAVGSLESFSLAARLENAIVAYAAYLWKLLWPMNLYIPHLHSRGSIPLGQVAGAASVLIAITAASIRVRASHPYVLVGWLWYLGTLLPVIGLVQVGTQAWADRYTYLPGVGLTLAIVAGLLALVPERWGLVVGSFAALALLSATRAQVRVWESSATLFEHALRVTERNPVALEKLGEVALDEGDLARATDLFQRTLAIQPADVDALDNLALVHLAEGELDRAQALLERALVVAPGERDTLLNLGAVALEREDWDAARERFDACLALDPADADALYNLGNLAQRTGRPDEAEARFRAAIAAAPAHADAWSNLGQVLLGAGRTDEALAAFERVVALAPEDPLAHFNLAIARRRAGDAAGARRHLERTLELDPTFEPAREALATLAAGSGG